MSVVDNKFGCWFSGFVDGEGHFEITLSAKIPSTRFTIKIRDDDSEVIYSIRDILQLGNVYELSPSGAPNANPQIKFTVVAVEDCLELIKIFDAYPLRSKKRKDYIVWKQAVLVRESQYFHHGRSHPYDKDALKELKRLGRKLVDGRKYSR